MGQVPAGRTTLIISAVAALITGPVVGAAASQNMPRTQGDALNGKTHPCLADNQQIDAKYCHDATGKAKPVDPNDPAVKAAAEASKQTVQSMNQGAAASKPHLVCLDHTAVVKFEPDVTTTRKVISFHGIGAFDKCSSSNKKLVKLKSARVVISGAGRLALNSLPDASVPNKLSCHAAGALNGSATLLWYDQEGLQGNPVGFAQVDFSRKAETGPAALLSTGKVTQTSTELSELHGNQVSSALKPQSGRCPARLNELLVEIDAAFIPAKPAG